MKDEELYVGQVTFFGGGEAGDITRHMDWTTTPLGPIDLWSAELKANVQTVLSSPVPMAILCGPEGILIYNDGYAAICGPRHPAAFGGKVLEVWPEAADFNAKVISAGMRGEPLSFHAQELELWRHGRSERVWMDLEYSPIRDSRGRPIGSLAMVFDITQRLLGERRLAQSEELYRFLDKLGQTVADLHDADKVLAETTRLVAAHLALSNWTTIELWLPQADAVPIKQSTASIDNTTTFNHRGKVLLVDDEEVVRTSAAHMLDEVGFDVIEASSAEAALAALDRLPDLDFLVTDHLMPGMDGVELVRRVKSVRPTLRCLIISGYADVEGIAHDVPRLTKPFKIEELREALSFAELRSLH